MYVIFNIINTVVIILTAAGLCIEVLQRQDAAVISERYDSPVPAYRLSPAGQPGLSARLPPLFIGSGFISSPARCPDAAARRV